MIIGPRQVVPEAGSNICNALHVENRSKYVEISRNIHENRSKYVEISRNMWLNM